MVNLQTTSVKQAAYVALARLLVTLMLTLMNACSEPPVKEEPEAAPPPTRVEIKLSAGRDVNPDGADRASPVLVRLYQLKDIAKFGSTDFFALYEDDKAVLGDDLLKKLELTMAPGEIKNIGFEAEKDTRFLGIVAAFRDLDSAQWRASAAIPETQTTTVDITLLNTQIALTSSSKPTPQPKAPEPKEDED